MKAHRFIIALVLASAFALAAAPPALAKDKWISVRTKNFNVISNANEKDARQVALKLEQFVAVFSKIFKTQTVSTVPIAVYAFKDDASFAPFKPGNVAGYFRQGRDERIIALNMSANKFEHPLSVIFHEYTHLLTSYSRRDWPTWLNEGIAEFYSTFQVDGNKVTLGAPISLHVFLLREKKLMPIQEMIKVDRSSPAYNERSKQGVFYAQSWAFVHYLMLGNLSARQPQLSQFIKLIEEGRSEEQAFAEAFKTDYATLEKDLRNYVSKDRYSVLNVTLDSVEGEKDFTVTPLAEAEAQFHLGNLLVQGGYADQAMDYFKRAAKLDPNLAGAHEGFGFVSIYRGNYMEAKEHLKQAIALGTKNYLAHYYYAEAIFREATGDGHMTARMDPDAVKTILDELHAATQLMPGFAPPYALMGFIHLAKGEELERGLNAIRAAIRLEPQNKSYKLTLAQIQLRMQDYDAAKKTLEPLLAEADEPSIKSTAESLMKFIDNYAKPARPSERPSLEAADESGRPRLKRPAAPAEATVSEGDPSAGPSVKLEGTQVISGVLSAIECDGGGLVLVFKTADKLLRFSVADPVGLKFFSQDPEINLSIGCGPINHAAFVHFKPTRSDKTIFAGDAVAVEFKKRS